MLQRLELSGAEKGTVSFNKVAVRGHLSRWTRGDVMLLLAGHGRRGDEEQRYVVLCILKVVGMALAARWSEPHSVYVYYRDMLPKWRPLQSA
jgi:hypothetical protein